MFSPFMSIEEQVMPQNGGPGDSRQWGLDHSTNPLVSFIDADDTFSGAFALKTLRNNLLSDMKNVCCFSSFIEDQRISYLNHTQDSVWMFGKLYKRAFIQKYNIHFLPGSRANEDNGFNMFCKLCANPNEVIKYIPDVTYYWHFKEDSITRINNAEYSYGGSFPGYTDNMIYAIKEAEKACPFNGTIMQQSVSIFTNLYEYWIETTVRDPRFEKQNWDCCFKYYKEVYRPIKDRISDKILAEIYNITMKNCYAGNKLMGIVPKMTLFEFIEKMEERYQKEEKKKKE